jgi:4-hydroxythreonine-4-phosphate dehydrogenase
VNAPPLALSLGDPAGIGPEIVAKAWRALRAEGPAFMVVGDARVLAAAAPEGERLLRRVSGHLEAAAAFADALPVFDMPCGAPVVAGRPDPACAPAVIGWIETAVRLAMSGEARGVVTAPIAKAPLYAAGFRHPGHTEFLAELTGGDPSSPPVMMLSSCDLRTVLATIHIPLAEVAGALDHDHIVRIAQVTARALVRDFGIERPRLAMAALNPHGGESGALGREEIEIIAPAARTLRAMGVDCSDPRPADTLFHAEARAAYDAVVCMYHDQALIPVKMLDFWGGVNVTLGLPIVRASPDHGVGFDIAGRGLARADSLIAAIRMASVIAERRGGTARAA